MLPRSSHTLRGKRDGGAFGKSEVTNVRIIISPAKKMREDTDSLAWRDLPAFLPQAEVLLSTLRALSDAELAALWKCSEPLAVLNAERVRTMDLRARLTPAILAYEGIQYQYMGPGVFTDREFDYVQEHLRILSGFYGLLRPFDGVTPYRLEMQAKLRVGESKDLYAYWGERLAAALCAQSDCLVNLASKEYSVCVSRYLPPSVRMITCVFGEEKNGKIVERATMCKMARGEMVRFLAEHQVTEPEQMKEFDRLAHRFDPVRSDDSTYVFVRPGKGVHT